jgi:hypothetical protein
MNDWLKGEKDRRKKNYSFLSASCLMFFAPNLYSCKSILILTDIATFSNTKESFRTNAKKLRDHFKNLKFISESLAIYTLLTLFFQII